MKTLNNNMKKYNIQTNMVNQHKCYAVGLSMVLAWTLPSTVLGLLLAIVVYTHPYSQLIFLYLDACVESYSQALPQTQSQSLPQTQSQSLPQTQSQSLPQTQLSEWNAYFCQYTSKPTAQGFCKRHIKASNPEV
jgi:hypothetical protein